MKAKLVLKYKLSLIKCYIFSSESSMSSILWILIKLYELFKSCPRFIFTFSRDFYLKHGYCNVGFYEVYIGRFELQIIVSVLKRYRSSSKLYL